MILATDLDGTLLYPKRRLGVLSRPNREFLRDLHQRGWEIVVVSGRNSRLHPYLNRDLGFGVSYIGCNGGFILDESGNLVRKQAVPTQLALDIYARMVERCGLGAWALMDESEKTWYDVHNLSAAITAMVVVFNFFSFRYKEGFTLKQPEFLHRLARGEVCKLMPVIQFGPHMKERIHRAYHTMNQQYGDQCSIVVSRIALEITARGVSKGSALSEFAKERQVPVEEVIAAGDSGNDVSMFDTFPHSFCMRSADPWVQAHAAHIIDRVDQIQEYLDHPERMSDDLVTFERRRVMPIAPIEEK